MVLSPVCRHDFGGVPGWGVVIGLHFEVYRQPKSGVKPESRPVWSAFRAAGLTPMPDGDTVFGAAGIPADARRRM